MRRRTPQEKKQLSYAKDRRNQYGENDKSSRRNIRQGKRRAARITRHRADQTLRQALGQIDERAERAELTSRARRPRKFHKVPDLPLGAVIAKRNGVQGQSPGNP